MQELKNTSHKALWKITEDYVQSYLEKQGFELIKKHYHTPFAEIDLFMRHPSGFFIIEVKTVSHFEMLDRVKYSKQFERLRRAYLHLLDCYDQKIYTLLAVVENSQKLYIFENFLDSFPNENH